MSQMLPNALLSNGEFNVEVTQQGDTPQSLDMYQINAAGVFFPAMHITQFYNLLTSDSFSLSGSHIVFTF